MFAVQSGTLQPFTENLEVARLERTGVLRDLGKIGIEGILPDLMADDGNLRNQLRRCLRVDLLHACAVLNHDPAG